uniref:hypothetical protein n=1 Tax=Methylobacterium sp. B34 TaxID=95563 RepID=UPI0019553367
SSDSTEPVFCPPVGTGIGTRPFTERLGERVHGQTGGGTGAASTGSAERADRDPGVLTATGR